MGTKAKQQTKIPEYKVVFPFCTVRKVLPEASSVNMVLLARNHCDGTPHVTTFAIDNILLQPQTEEAPAHFCVGIGLTAKDIRGT